MTVSALHDVPGLAVYVYYQVHAAQRDAAQRAVDAMQAELRRAHAGLSARLMRRADALVDGRDDTWMEVYEHPQGVGPACMTRLSQLASALPSGLMGARHVETFYPLAAGPAGGL